MINSSIAEAYFIAAMMVLILVLSIAATVFFVRQYKREKRENPLTRKNLANFQASMDENKKTNQSAKNQTSKQTEYAEK